jgi:4-amino-4-deoxy-L-arabinose transferase-like glycosyltransferase
VLGILALGFGLRLATVMWLPDTAPFSDYEHYHFAAERILENWAFYFDRTQYAPYVKLDWWPPLYPHFLAGVYSLFGPSPRAAAFLQVLLGTCVCWLVYRVGRRAGGETAGRLAMLAVAVDPTYVFLTNLLASENLFAVWLALGLYLVGRPWNRARGYAIPGVAFGLGALTRAAGLLVPVVAGVWLLRRLAGTRARWRAIAWLLAGSAVIVLPWTPRNYLVSGSAALVCFGGGVNFYFGHNDVSIGYRDLSQTPMAGTSDQVEADRMGYRLGWEHIVSHPLGFFTRGARKVVALFGPSSYAPHQNSIIKVPAEPADPAQARATTELVARYRAKARQLDGIYTWLTIVHSYLLFAGTALGLFLIRRAPEELQLAAWLFFAWIAAHVFYWANPRFRYPMEILMALVVAGGVAAISRARHSKASR